ncbi:hypothetical protein GCM10009530_47530 [Microbispora corallina]|uniref:Secreted protein n=1 Tax=Microbispora corallina TaxID=83302 RepID=A0ABQ4G5I1_9ACTN|nr:hypothetical protein [Microbispora corallina]GIH42328.1 hypothetical protein Mco01_53280 [Microbispora corallina]
MRVGARSVTIIFGLAMAALAVSGLGYTALRTSTGSECTSAEEALIPVLAAQTILAARPDSAVARDRYSGCFQDDPFPYAGTFYEFRGHRESYASFYEAKAKADGWRPVVADEPSEDVCYTKKVGDATAFLSVGANSVDAVQGYSITVSASYQEVPEDGGLLC